MSIFNRNKIVVLGLSGTMLLTSCQAVQNANNTQKGTAIGATAGAVLGGIIGNNAGKGGNGTLGAVLGGIIGGAAGGVIGNKMDKQAREIKTALPGAEVERVNEGIKITFNETMVNFGFDSAELTSNAKNNLDKLAQVLVDNPDTNINILGHTDSRGADAYNQRLSERRANAVVNYLYSLGVAKNRMTAKGLGESEPIATNETDEGRAKNRRVEFAITANEKMIEKAQQGY
ncbi:MAG: OmpA family protein [Flavobacteriaceae bacterium]|nr:OmpA family protein [Flavobacteriaceae bacterium]